MTINMSIPVTGIICTGVYCTLYSEHSIIDGKYWYWTTVYSTTTDCNRYRLRTTGTDLREYWSTVQDMMINTGTGCYSMIYPSQYCSRAMYSTVYSTWYSYCSTPSNVRHIHGSKQPNAVMSCNKLRGLDHRAMVALQQRH